MITVLFIVIRSETLRGQTMAIILTVASAATDDRLAFGVKYSPKAWNFFTMLFRSCRSIQDITALIPAAKAPCNASAMNNDMRKGVEISFRKSLLLQTAVRVKEFTDIIPTEAMVSKILCNKSPAILEAA